MANAIVLLAEGFEEVEALTVVDVLRRGGVKVTMAAVGEKLEVAGAHGIRVIADALFAGVSGAEYDALILPGGGAGTENLRANAHVIERIRRQKSEGRLICAICAAPLILVDARVLDEQQHITCYPTCVMDLDRASANVPVVVDGDVITGQAPGAAMLFGLVILQHLIGDPVAHKVARGLVTDVLD